MRTDQLANLIQKIALIYWLDYVRFHLWEIMTQIDFELVRAQHWNKVKTNRGLFSICALSFRCGFQQVERDMTQHVRALLNNGLYFIKIQDIQLF